MSGSALIELGAALGALITSNEGPSHDQITTAARRAGLSQGDPKQSATSLVGKTRRIRGIMAYASDGRVDGGLQFAAELVAGLRATGAFDPAAETYAGQERLEALRRAYAQLGWSVDARGGLAPLSIDNLSGTALTDALRAYVDRVNTNPDDVALTLGTAKELGEAAARHVLEQLVGTYDHRLNFPVTLANAFSQLGLAVPTKHDVLDTDPHRAVQEALFLLAIAVNRLRNQAGTGHGRPGPGRVQPLTPAEARLVARASALVAGRLLDGLTP